MLNRLDPLAREVIYSRTHTLEQPYEMTSTETLNQVANRYQVPWQLLANINGIEDPVTILPGTKLKVLRGPYRAEVNLTRNETDAFCWRTVRRSISNRSWKRSQPDARHLHCPGQTGVSHVLQPQRRRGLRQAIPTIHTETCGSISVERFVSTEVPTPFGQRRKGASA